MRADSLSLIKDLSQISTSTSSGVVPQQLVCERDPVFHVSSGMDRERPDTKEGWIYLKCLKFRLAFHVTRWRDVWIPCIDPRESRRSPPHLDRGNHISSWDDMGYMEHSSSCCTDINIHIDLRRVSQGISLNSSMKSSHLYCMLWNTG